MERKKFWTILNSTGYVVGFAGFLLVVTLWTTSNAALSGSLIFNLETVGLVLVLTGFVLAVAGGLALGNMWPYGPIK